MTTKLFRLFTPLAVLEYATMIAAGIGSRREYFAVVAQPSDLRKWTPARTLYRGDVGGGRERWQYQRAIKKPNTQRRRKIGPTP
ncbi:MAG: hypothetical protein ACJAYC_001507 [Halieaceae bacterium]